MPKRITDVERITAYFQAADALEAETMFKVIRGILTSRSLDTGQRKVTTKKSTKGARSAASRSLRKTGAQSDTRNSDQRMEGASSVGGDGSEDVS